LVLHTLVWLAGEKWFMAGRGLAFGWRAAAAALVREALAPVLMVQALAGRTIAWRGTDLGGQWRAQRARPPSTGDGASKGPVLSTMDAAPDIATIKLPEYTDSMSSLRVEEVMLGAGRCNAAPTVPDGGGNLTIWTWLRAAAQPTAIVLGLCVGVAGCQVVPGDGPWMNGAQSTSTDALPFDIIDLTPTTVVAYRPLPSIDRPS